MEELKVYMIDIDKLSDEDEEVFNEKECMDFLWMDISEKQGLIYSLSGFVKCFNNERLNQNNLYIRIL